MERKCRNENDGERAEDRKRVTATERHLTGSDVNTRKEQTSCKTYNGDQCTLKLLQKIRKTYCFENNQNSVDLFHLSSNVLIKFLLF